MYVRMCVYVCVCVFAKWKRGGWDRDMGIGWMGSRHGNGADGIATWELGGWDRDVGIRWMGSQNGNGLGGIATWERSEWNRGMETR